MTDDAVHAVARFVAVENYLDDIESEAGADDGTFFLVGSVVSVPDKRNVLGRNTLARVGNFDAATVFYGHATHRNGLILARVVDRVADT